MSDSCLIVGTDSVEQTLDLGRRIGAALHPGDVLGLVGQLGAGKTYLVKGIAAGLEIPDRLVNSPTFVIVNEYAGRAPVHHLDAYRLTNTAELLDLGFEEMCAGRAIVIVEWADRVQSAMPERTLRIQIAVTDESKRAMTIRCADTATLQRIEAALSEVPTTTRHS